MIDANRSAVYAAESLVADMIDRGADVAFHGTRLALQPDRKFGQVADIERYLAWVRSHPWGCPDVPRPVIRQRRGAAKAVWEAPVTIAVPDAAWARREMVVLHEYAHHVTWHRSGRTDPRHGPAFCRNYADLVRMAVDPATGLLLTDAFHQAGLFGP